MTTVNQSEMNPPEVTAPYVPFKTFQTSLDRLHEGIPHRIDKSVFPSFAYTTITQLLATFRFFGLIDEKGIPQPELKPLTIKDEARAPLLKKLLEKSYAELLKMDLTKATPDQMNEAFRKYNVAGDTQRKAIAFFLQAAQFSKLSVSTLLENKIRRGTAPGTARRRRTKFNGNGVEPPMPTPAAPKTTNGTSRMITLKSGGKLILEVEIDVLRLIGDDRSFVFGLIDSLDEYERKNQKETASE